jgi:hypothetical protein
VIDFDKRRKEPMALVPLLISLVVFCIVAYILYLIVGFVVGHFGLPQPVAHILMLIFGLIILLMFLDTVGLYSSGLSVYRVR